MIYYIMGVTSSGKTTIGTLLAQKLNIPFFDGDDFHPESNIQKMSQGIPLTDTDRIPWLENIANSARSFEEKGGAIFACSALKKSYRNILKKGLEASTQWIFLSGNQQLIQARMDKRSDHFMPSTLLQSQFDTLESPIDEEVLTIDVSAAPEVLVEEILIRLGLG